MLSYNYVAGIVPNVGDIAVSKTDVVTDNYLGSRVSLIQAMEEK